MKDNYFSLILCSVGEIIEIRKFFIELKKQEYKNFEIILVDQNLDDRLEKIVLEYSKYYKIKHLKSEKGLSRARNKGMKYAKGDIVAFPDDDCIYPSDLLKNVNKFFKEKKYDGLVIRAVNSVPNGRVMHKNDLSQNINKINILKLVHSISLFLKKEIIETVGEFDENLGLGSNTIFQGQEDRDYPIRALEKGFNLYFNRDIIIYHPWDDKLIDKQKNLIDRFYKGSASEMYLLKKHKYSLNYKLFRLFRRIAIIIYFTLKRDNYKLKANINALKAMIKYFNVKI